MSIAPEKTVSPDDLLLMPDGGKEFELVDGRLKETNVSLQSSYIAGEAYLAMRLFCRDRQPGWVFPEGTSFRCFPFDDTRVRRADAAFIELARLSEEQFRTQGHCRVAPDLVVEVVSPNDSADDVDAKVVDWLSAGVRLVWVISPAAGHIRVYPSDAQGTILRSTDTLAGEPVLPGFAVPVADLFRLPETMAR